MIADKDKYRAWVIDYIRKEKYMADVISIDHAGEYITYIYDGGFGYRIRQAADFKDIELMQCTGLRDKNGKLIYAGDIVEFKHAYKNRSGIYQVIYDKYRFDCEGFFQSHYDCPCEAFSEGTQYFEVIGNVHENRELLKGGADE